MEPFRFVVVGTGNIANTYFAAVDKLDGVEIVGAVSRDLARAQAVAKERGLAAAATRLEDIDTPYDAIFVCGPNGTHGDMAIAAAKLGKHTLTEKTIDVSSAKADEMLAVCEEAGVQVAVCYQRRVSPDNHVIKKLLQEKAFGKIYAVDLAVRFYRPQSYYDSAPYRGTKAIDGGGPFVQQASHNLDILCWFFGLPTEVKSMLTMCGHTDIEVEDHGAAVLRYADGMLGTIVASTIAKPGFPGRLEIYTEKGSFSMINDAITNWQIDGIENPATPTDMVIHTGASVAVTDTHGHEGMIRDFVDSIRAGRRPIGHGSSTRLATDLIEMIYDASGFYG